MGVVDHHLDAAPTPAEHELVERRVGPDPTPLDQHDTIGQQLGTGEDVGGEEDRPTALRVLPQEGAHDAGLLDLEPVHRLVEQQHRGVAGERGDERHGAPHTGRERVGAPVRVVVDPQRRGQVRDAVARTRDPVADEGEMVAHRAAGMHLDTAQVHAEHLVGPRVLQERSAAELDPSRAGGETAQAAHERRLPGPVPTQDQGHRSGLGSQVHIGEHGVPAVAAPEARHLQPYVVMTHGDHLRARSGQWAQDPVGEGGTRAPPWRAPPMRGAHRPPSRRLRRRAR